MFDEIKIFNAIFLSSSHDPLPKREGGVITTSVVLDQNSVCKLREIMMLLSCSHNGEINCTTGSDYVILGALKASYNKCQAWVEIFWDNRAVRLML